MISFFGNRYKPVRYEFKPDLSERLINEYIPRNETSIVEYECFPSYSSMQFAEITDMNGSVIVARFGMRSGSDFHQHSMNMSSNVMSYLKIEEGSSYSINRSSTGYYYVRKIFRSKTTSTISKTTTTKNSAIATMSATTSTTSTTTATTAFTTTTLITTTITTRKTTALTTVTTTTTTTTTKMTTETTTTTSTTTTKTTSIATPIITFASTILTWTSSSGSDWTKPTITTDMTTITHQTSAVPIIYKTTITNYNGGWSSWGPLSDCTVTCGLGVQTRLRLCNNPSYGYYFSFILRDNFNLRPRNGGATCDGDNIELSTCHEKECPIGTGDRRYTECKKYGQRAGKTLFPAAVPSHASNQCLLYCRESSQTPYDTNTFVPTGKS